MRRAFLALLLASIGAAPAAARDSLEEVRAAIQGQNRRLAEAVARGDDAAAGGIYAADARMMLPDMTPIEGNVAIGEFWGAKREKGVADLLLETRDLVLGKGTATEVGAYRVRGLDTKLLEEGSYVVVWMKVDGTWRIWRDLRTSGP